MSLHHAFEAIVAVTALSLLSTPAVAADAPQPSATAEEAFSQIAGCVSTSEQTNVLFVIDESLSLRDSDPDNQRSQALKIAIGGLADLQRSAPDKKIMVAASTFSTDYVERLPWQRADDQSIRSLKEFATQQVPALNAGEGTDYRRAMLGARKQLVAQPEGCRIMLWFTDGGLDVDDETQAVYEEICAPKGVADTLRRDRISVVAVALFNEDLSNITDQDRKRLQDIAEGTAAGQQPCGTVPLPETSARGAYLPADNAARLAQVFGDALSRIGGYSLDKQVVCSGPDCPDGAVEFPVDPGVARMRISVYAVDGSPVVFVKPPKGTEVQVQDGVARIGTAPAEVTAAGAATQVDLDTTDSRSSGIWRVRVEEGEAWVEAWLSPELTFVLRNPQQTVSAEEGTDVAVVLQRRDGSAIDPKDFEFAGPTAEVGDQDAKVEQESGAEWQVTVPPVTSGNVPRRMLLSIQLGLQTKPSGVTLQPLTQTFSLPVTTSAAYPQVITEELTFPDVTTAATVSAALDVVGASTGPSQICLEQSTFTGPTGEVALEPVAGSLNESGCMDLAPNEQRSLSFEARPETIADGQVSGTIDLRLVSARPTDRPLTLSVPTSLAMSRPIDAVKFSLLLALLVLAAVLLPLLIALVLGKWLLARFADGSVPYVDVPVEVVTDGGDRISLRSRGSASLDIPATEIRVARVSGQPRSVSIEGLVFEARFQFWRRRKVGPFGSLPMPNIDAFAVARLKDGSGRCIASNLDPFALDGDSAPASLRLERNWFLTASAFEVDPAKPFPARLVAFGMTSGFPQEEMRQRTPSVQIERVVHALIRAATEARKRTAKEMAPVAAPSVGPDSDTQDDGWI